MNQCIIYNYVLTSYWTKRLGLSLKFATTEIVPAVLAMRIAWSLYVYRPGISDM